MAFAAQNNRDLGERRYRDALVSELFGNVTDSILQVMDLTALVAPDPNVTKSDIVISGEELIRQPSYDAYRDHVARLWGLARDAVLICAYDCPPVNLPPGAFYFEPITRTLARLPNLTECSVVGKHRDLCYVLARKRPHTGHARDLSPDDFNLMSAVTDHPLLLRQVVDTARERLGFFPAQLPRAIEYPWVLASLPQNLAGWALADVGAGVNPVPLQLAERGAAVYTVDGHHQRRDLPDQAAWNEWGFLDYSSLDKRITSFQCPFEEWSSPARLDCIYSISVIEHVPARTRRRWIQLFAAQLRAGGVLLLTMDLFAETSLLRNFSEGMAIETESEHGDLSAVVDEVRHAGFEVGECWVKRNVPRSRVDTAFLRAVRRGPEPNLV